MIQIENNDNKFFFLYEILIIVLAIIAVTLTLLDFNNYIILEPNSPLYWLDLGILIIFAIDYFVRFFLSKNKKSFFVNNIFGLIAIIPFNSMFRIFRAFRLFKFLRITRVARVTRVFRMTRLIKGFALLGKIKRRLNVFVNTNGFIYTIYITTVTIILGSIGIYYFEFKELGETFANSLWWSFITTSTGGYADITPVTLPGRLITVILMFVGIGFIGFLTGTITTYFLNRKDFTDDDGDITQTIIDLSDLEEDKIKQVLDYIEFIRNRS